MYFQIKQDECLLIKINKVNGFMLKIEKSTIFYLIKQKNYFKF